MKRKIKKRKKHFGVFEFPTEAINHGVSVCIYDECGCTVRNFRELMAYSPSLIIMQTEIGKLMLKGKDMELVENDAYEIKITGSVRMAEFSES